MSQNSNNNQPQSDITFRQVFAVGFAVLGLSVYQKFGSFERIYLHFYNPIWQILYGLAAGLIILTILQFKKRTAALTARVQLLSGLAQQSGSVWVGTSHDGVPLYLSDEQRTGHVQILGSTGRGKTESVISSWLCRDLANGRTPILIDGKGDPGILQQINDLHWGPHGIICSFIFDIGNPEKSIVINPLANGSAQQITDRIFTAFTFEDPYYKAVQADVALTVIQAIKERQFEQEITFTRLYDLLTNDDHLTELARNCPNVVLQNKLTSYLTQPKVKRQENLSGLLSQIAPFAVGELAPLVNGKQDRRWYTNISDVVLGTNDSLPPRFVFAVLIPTLKYQNIGHQLGKLILQELGWAVGERASRSGEPPFVPVFLDEFSSFVYPNFASILNKARSSNVALHLSHQSLGDLSAVSESFAQVVNTNTNVKCILGINDPDSADWIASHFGTETTEKVTERAEKGFLNPREKTGQVSVREVEAYKVHPNQLKSFVQGRGVLHLPTASGPITEVIQFERVGGNG